MRQFKNNYSLRKTLLQTFGVEWVRKWLDLRERLVEIAKVMRRYPWMVDAVRQRPMSILHPYTVEVYVARDGSEACISLNPPKAYCAQDGAVKEAKLELEFKQYETYEEKIKRDIQTKGAIGIHRGGERIREGTLGLLAPPRTSCAHRDASLLKSPHEGLELVGHLDLLRRYQYFRAP